MVMFQKILKETSSLKYIFNVTKNYIYFYILIKKRYATENIFKSIFF